MQKLSLVFLWFISLPLLANPFHQISFEEALKMASSSNKVVMIDFYTTWCGPCKLLDKRTWTDESVRKWLREKTIALKIDAEEQVKLAKRYGVDAYPTLTFIKSDGTQMGRLVGYKTPDQFKTEADKILAGEDPLARFKQQWDEKSEDPQFRMQFGDALKRHGQPEKALEHYLWAYDHGKTTPQFVGVRGSFLVMRIKSLFKKLPHAKTEIQNRRSAVQKEVAAGELQSLFDLVSLNKALNEEAKNLTLWEQYRHTHKENPFIHFLFKSVLHQLRSQGRYQDIHQFKPIKDQVSNILENYQLKGKMFADLKKEEREQYAEMDLNIAISSLADCYEVLLGLNKVEEAKALADKAFEISNKPNTLRAFASAGLRSGKTASIHLKWAEEAFKVEPEVLDSLTTYALILHASDQQDEALRLIEKNMDQFNNREQVRLGFVIEKINGK